MLSPLQQRKLTHLFRVYDVDRNGLVEEDDFHLVVARIAAQRGWSDDHPARLKLLGRYLNQFQALLAGAETGSSGRIALESWLALWNAILDTDYQDRVRLLCDVLFDAMDEKGEGRFTLRESRHWFEAHGMPAETADQVFPLCDLDGDGWFSKEEWLMLVDQFFWGNDPSEPGTQLFGPLSPGNAP